MSFFYIALGGGFGAVSRYALGKKIDARNQSFYPVGTFLINLSGALLLGILTAWSLPDPLNALLCDGFLGAFTTFSTFMREGYTLMDKRTGHGTAYIAITLILGISSYFLGYHLVLWL